MMPDASDSPAGQPPRWIGRVLDLIYPPTCALCEMPLADGRALCPPCVVDLPVLQEPFCSRCGEAFHGRIEGSFTCPNCKDLKFAFEFARPALVRDPRSLELIHRLKYQKQLFLAPELARLALQALQDPRFAPALAAGWPLVPVPLHRSRQRERHFNQSLEIARSLSRLTGLPMLKALARTRRTDTQTRLSRARRLQNLRGAFAVTAAGHRFLTPKPAGVILIDDVLTTGSTVDACARTLRQAGLPRIFVLTVLRG
jgi:competence protein ComFC